MEANTVIYSFVVPIYNDGYLAKDFCTEYEKVFKSYLKTEYISDKVELIFVNDGSPDNSIEHLATLHELFPFVRVIDLSRNFGQHIALSAGYAAARGQYVGMLNVDMEDPPDQIPLMLNEMKGKKLDLLVGMREKREAGFFKKVTSTVFYSLLNWLTGNYVPTNAATLRVMSRRFTDAYNSLSEKSRYLPGLETWLGFNSGYLYITHQQRKKGKSSYNFKRRLSMATESILSFSDFPLKLITGFGLIVAVIGFLLIAILVLQKLFFVNFMPGYTSTVSIIVFLAGVQILVIGMASLYIGRILKEVQNRPLYIIKEKYNF